MIDLCPRCRIQAPHRPGREACPRCGGPLRVVDSGAPSSVPGRVAQQATPGPVPHPRPAPSHPHRPAQPTAPVTGPRSGRIYRNRHVRWVARRPPESIPPRRPAVAVGPRAIPRYTYLPTWGLFDRPTIGAVDQRTRLDESADALGLGLRVLTAALAFSAVAHVLRYVLLVVNRGTPVAGWLDKITWVLVTFGGLIALAAYVFATVAMVRWVLALRADAYRRHDRLDPRRRWIVIALVAVPLLNLVGAPWMIVEAARLRDDLDTERTRRRLTRMWVGWAIINGLALLTIATRLTGMSSGSIQTSVNALVLVILSSAVSAVFAWWLSGRLRTTFDAAEEISAPATRWVPVG